MKIETYKNGKSITIIIEKLDNSDKEILMNFINSFRCFYPFYIIHSNLVNLSGFLNSEKFNEFNSYSFKELLTNVLNKEVKNE